MATRVGRSWLVRLRVSILVAALALLAGASGAWAQPPLGEGGGARPETVPLPGLDLLASGPALHWTPPDPSQAPGAKGSRPPASSLPEPNPALLLRSDLNRSVPLPDPGFEFKAGPSAAAKPAVEAKGQAAKPVNQLYQLPRLPVSFSVGTLDRDLGVGEATTIDAPHREAGLPGGVEPGGYLALRWRPENGPGLDLGGGYQRGHAATSGEGYAWQVASPGPVMAMRELYGPPSTSYQTYGRWAAFMAVPYQLLPNLGLRPEVSYYYSENPDLGRAAGNEWVMGLQFTFGF